MSYERCAVISTWQNTLSATALNTQTACAVCLQKNQTKECSKNNLRDTLWIVLLKSVSLFISSSLLYK